MNGKALGQKVEAAKSSTRMNRVPEKVKIKLKTFTVKDSKGNSIGNVKDVYFDAKGELIFLVSGYTSQNESCIFSLKIKLLQKVDYQQKILYINRTLEQIQTLAPTKVLHNSEASTEMPPITETEISSSPSNNPPKVMSNQTDTEVRENLETGDDEGELDIVDREVIKLLEERLVINRSKRKVGEVIVRKEIETRLVEVPIQREKLIVEKVGEEPQVLAEIDLGEGEITGVEASEKRSDDGGQPKVMAEFTSVAKASKMLNSIAAQPRHGCAKVRIELVLENQQLQETYQTWIDEYKG